MTTYTPRDYELDKEYRNRKLAAAQKRQLTEAIQPEEHRMTLPSRRTLLLTILILGLAALLISPSAAHAQDGMARPKSDASPTAPIELALILGQFYYDNGNYDEAVAQYTQAIALIPEALYELQPEWAVLYWQLGEAQEKAGQLEEALMSYQRYLTLAGEGATPYAVKYVMEFEVNLTETDA